MARVNYFRAFFDLALIYLALPIYFNFSNYFYFTHAFNVFQNNYALKQRWCSLHASVVIIVASLSFKHQCCSDSKKGDLVAQAVRPAFGFRLAVFVYLPYS